ncbi:MAG: hypothetical protein HY866_10310 [Chloroflexi bacterium]|nr:hypothetical protein [Chloroflexota bacterium]
MFPPTSPMTERVRIENEAAELKRRLNRQLNQHAETRRPFKMPVVLLSVLRFFRAKRQPEAQSQPVTQPSRLTKGV